MFRGAVGIRLRLVSNPCPSGYMQDASGFCVDVQNDFNNCGAINAVCSASFVYCLNGVCGGVPAVQLASGTPVGGRDRAALVNGSIITISPPFVVRLYDVALPVVALSSSGVRTSASKSGMDDDCYECFLGCLRWCL